jgi:V-type H+-transporting ATPase subunit a
VSMSIMPYIRNYMTLSVDDSCRYMILFMGFFAVYAGFIYNDFLACGLNLFGSSYKPCGEGEECQPKDNYEPYPFGIDPAWKGATNELSFANSMKMKFAVLVSCFKCYISDLV